MRDYDYGWGILLTSDCNRSVTGGQRKECGSVWVWECRKEVEIDIGIGIGINRVCNGVVTGWERGKLGVRRLKTGLNDSVLGFAEKIRKFGTGV